MTPLEQQLAEALDRLEVSANTVSGCYTKRPENFASALQELEADAESAREVLAEYRRQLDQENNRVNY
jgi:ABC-type transporter Mla subunit MlaD